MGLPRRARANRTWRHRSWIAAIAAGSAIGSVTEAACVGDDPQPIQVTGSPDGGEEGGAAADGAVGGDGAVTNDGAGTTSNCNADLTSDPGNCGECGRICSSCDAGICAPKQLVGNLSNPYSLLTEGRDVYFSTVSFPSGPVTVKQALHHLLLYPTAVAPPITDQRSFINGLAVTSTEIYWADLGGNGEVVRCSRQLCNSPVIVANVGSTITSTVVVGQKLFWANRDQKRIQLCLIPATNCTPTDAAIIPIYPQEIATDGTSLFWTAFDVLDDSKGAVYRCSVAADCNDWQPVATDQRYPLGIAVYDGNVYWVNQGTRVNDFSNGAIWTATTAGEGAHEFFKTAKPGRIAVDKTGVYWTTPDAVQRCPLSGCNPKPLFLAVEQKHPASVVLGSDDVFWVTSGTVLDGGTLLDDGELLTVPK